MTPIQFISALFSLFYIITPHATTIYKSVDKDGNVTFSQQPSQHSIKMQLPETKTSPVANSVSQDIKEYQDEQTKNLLSREKLAKELTKIDMRLADLAKAKKRADAIVKECMTKPRIRLLDYSKCPKGTIDKSQCVIVNNIPTTPENCKRPSYHEMMKLIDDLSNKRHTLIKEMKQIQ